jgi:hypothetical protein
MAFGHEELDVYRAAIEYVGWAYRFCQRGYAVHEAPGKYRTAEIDPDSDTDPERCSDRQPPTTGGRRRNTAPPQDRWGGWNRGLTNHAVRLGCGLTPVLG